MTLEKICIPIAETLKQFNEHKASVLNSDVTMVNTVIRHQMRKKGKQIRPVLVFLTAGLCGKIDDNAFTAATMAELIHTATLVHDDVVDEADERRGIMTINAAWNNKVAVLIGDFLLAKGLLTAINRDAFDFLRAASNTIQMMSEGELLQIQKSRENDLSEETYFNIIRGKTASLLSVCCEFGALAAKAGEEKADKMKIFGEKLGLAFQIKDDIIDYIGTTSVIGKRAGNDLKEKKITLPLIKALKHVDDKKAKSVVKKIKGGKLSSDNIDEIISFVNDNGGIEESYASASSILNEAKIILDDFAPSIYKTSLMELTEFIVKRSK